MPKLVHRNGIAVVGFAHERFGDDGVSAADSSETGKFGEACEFDRNVLGAFSGSLQNRYGRLAGVVAGTDGALWLTTRNRDGHGTPIADDDRVIRISPADSSASPVT